MDIHFHETMAGHYRGMDQGIGTGRFRFTIDVDCPDARDLRVLNGTIRGTASMEGVVEDAPLQGTIEVSPWSKRTIAYAFTFALPDGRSYRFAGVKSVTPLHPVHSMTYLPGKLYDARGTVVAEVETRFATLRHLLPFLASWRFRRTRHTTAGAVG
jgi:hypothetical protein